jgi:translocation and assembly module TamA
VSSIRYLRCLLLTIFGLLVSPSAWAGDIELQATDEVSALLKPHLPKELGNPRRLQQEFSEALATEGYFSPSIEFTERGGSHRITIDAGSRTVVSEVQIVISGDIDQASRDKLIAGWKLPAGEPFRQAQWNSAKQEILSKLLAEDHARARLEDSAAEIDPQTRTARLIARYDAGRHYRFGAIRIEGLETFSAELVGRYNRVVTPGEVYREDKLRALQTNLQSTPYFSSAEVALIESEAVEENGVVTAPVLIRVREQAMHHVGVGGGYSSNTGARVETSYRTPHVFNQPWELQSGVRIEQKKQSAFGDIFLPPDQSNRRNSFGALVESTDIEGLITERYAFGIQTTRRVERTERQLSLQWQGETSKPDNSTAVTTQALVPGVMWTWRKIDDPLNPVNASVLQFKVSGGSKAVYSEENFIQLYGRAQQYLSLGGPFTLTLRGEAGRTQVETTKNIPQDYLFRTGGSGSVRGYSYKSLGALEGTATVGARFLVVASAEVTVWFGNSWGIATFFDAGDAFDHAEEMQIAQGYGIGGRWRSPVGPIGLDVAYGRRTDEYIAHFSISIPF